MILKNIKIKKYKKISLSYQPEELDTLLLQRIAHDYGFRSMTKWLVSEIKKLVVKYEIEQNGR